MTAPVLYLADYRHTEPVPMIPPAGEVGKRPVRRGLPYRLTHSPFVADVRRNGIAVGYLIAVAFVIVWSWTR